MKVASKVALTSIVLGTACTFSILATLVFGHQRVLRETDRVLETSVQEQADRVAETVIATCRAAEASNQRRLDHSLGIAHQLLSQLGPVSLESETLEWQAVNQLTKQATAVRLPVVRFGSTRITPNDSTRVASPVVDETRRLTDDFCTIFQRINDEGDMLRICTSVVKTNGTRAVGTFIPARDASGAANPVVQTVLAGQTYRGRAFVVDDWHSAAYQPLWDVGHSRVIGMLYVGVALRNVNRELLQTLAEIHLGKSGGVSVLGAKGGQRGQVLLDVRQRSRADAPTGDNRTPDVATTTAEAETLIQATENRSEPLVRTRRTSAVSGEEFLTLTYFAPWDWVICASACKNDFLPILSTLENASWRLLKWVFAVACFMGSVGFLGSVYLGGQIAGPITRAVQDLRGNFHQILAEANELVSSSEALSNGARQEADSLDQTRKALDEIAQTTRTNAEDARSMKELARDARQLADAGSESVAGMQDAMSRIQASGDDIAKIIRTIDEIAFQTNILALNAAVEAARAGEAGAGFGVVADEVRNLAQRSANAAKESGQKMQVAMECTSRGTTIGNSVAESLGKLRDSIHQVDQLAAKVAAASVDQSSEISRIGDAVRQVDEVTHRTAQGADACAHSAESLNAQGQLLGNTVSDLSALVGQSNTVDTPPADLAPQASPMIDTGSESSLATKASTHRSVSPAPTAGHPA